MLCCEKSWAKAGLLRCFGLLERAEGGIKDSERSARCQTVLGNGAYLSPRSMVRVGALHVSPLLHAGLLVPGPGSHLMELLSLHGALLMLWYGEYRPVGAALRSTECSPRK
jgi:hypothetical protein